MNGILTITSVPRGRVCQMISTRVRQSLDCSHHHLRHGGHISRSPCTISQIGILAISTVLTSAVVAVLSRMRRSLDYFGDTAATGLICGLALGWPATIPNASFVITILVAHSLRGARLEFSCDGAAIAGTSTCPPPGAWWVCWEVDRVASWRCGALSVSAFAAVPFLRVWLARLGRGHGFLAATIVPSSMSSPPPHVICFFYELLRCESAAYHYASGCEQWRGQLGTRRTRWRRSACST